MSDLSSYREKAANYGKLANQAETDKDYTQAFEYYTKALDIFSHMIKCKSRGPPSPHQILAWSLNRFAV